MLHAVADLAAQPFLCKLQSIVAGLCVGWKPRMCEGQQRHEAEDGLSRRHHAPEAVIQLKAIRIDVNAHEWVRPGDTRDKQYVQDSAGRENFGGT